MNTEKRISANWEGNRQSVKRFFSTFQPFNFSTFAFAVAAIAAMTANATPHVCETLKLTNGWNAVYIESTADESACEDFFRDTPVIAAAAYRSDADASTAQYDGSGNEIVQAPIIFLQWSRGESSSTLQSIIGGGTFLLFATNAADVTFYGVPSAPKMT